MGLKSFKTAKTAQNISALINHPKTRTSYRKGNSFKNITPKIPWNWKDLQQAAKCSKNSTKTHEDRHQKGTPVSLDPRQRIELSAEKQKQSALAWNQIVSLSRRAGDSAQALPALRAHEAKSEETSSWSAWGREVQARGSFPQTPAGPSPAWAHVHSESRKNSPIQSPGVREEGGHRNQPDTVWKY